MRLDDSVLCSFRSELEKTALSQRKMLAAGIKSIKRLAKRSRGVPGLGEVMGTMSSRQTSGALKAVRAHDISSLKALKKAKAPGFRAKVQGAISRSKRGPTYGQVASSPMRTRSSELPAFLRYGRPA